MASVACLGLCSSCAERNQGDVGGSPIQFDVHLDLGFLDGMHNTQGSLGVVEPVDPDLALIDGSADGQETVWTSASTESPPGPYFAFGVLFYSFYSIEVQLIAYDGLTHKEVFRHQLYWDDNHFVVPLIPSHALQLEVLAWGGREGTESLGPIAVPAEHDPHITIRLSADRAVVVSGTRPGPGPASVHLAP